MTLTEINHDVAAPARPGRPRWVDAAAGVLVGMLLTVGVVAMRPHPAAAVAGPVLSDEVRFEPVGGSAEFAGMWSHLTGPGRVASHNTATLVRPWTAALTVYSTGPLASCRIYVNATLMDEQFANAGHSATCVVTRG